MGDRKPGSSLREKDVRPIKRAVCEAVSSGMSSETAGFRRSYMPFISTLPFVDVEPLALRDAGEAVLDARRDMG